MQLAIDRQVDAVALTGDVVDETNRFYEAFAPLAAGVQRLLDAGVPVCAVAGNHDHEVLPRLARQIPQFRLLGDGGTWEEELLQSNGSATVRLLGWSFPARHVSGDPLAGYSLPLRPGIPTVGLLHCDCGASVSRYAPVSLEALSAQAVDAWVLGHTHKPDVLSAGPPLVLYTGSLQGLDASEPGQHGALLVTLEPGKPAGYKRIPLAALQYEGVDVSLVEVADREDFDRAVIEAIRTRHAAIREELGDAKAVACRLFLQGRTPAHRHLPSWMDDLADLCVPVDGVDCYVEKVKDLTRPDVDLEAVAGSIDPAGLLARRLTILEARAPAEDYEALIRDGRQATARRRADAVFALLGEAQSPDDETVRDLLLRSGLDMLEALLLQKEGPA